MASHAAAAAGLYCGAMAWWPDEAAAAAAWAAAATSEGFGCDCWV